MGLVSCSTVQTSLLGSPELHRSSRTKVTAVVDFVRESIAASRVRNALVAAGSFVCMALSSSALGSYRATETATGRNSIVVLSAIVRPETFCEQVTRTYDGVAAPDAPDALAPRSTSEHCGRAVSNVVTTGDDRTVPSSAFRPCTVALNDVPSGSGLAGSKSRVRVDAHRNEPAIGGTIVTKGFGSSCSSTLASAATGRSNSQRNTGLSPALTRPFGLDNTTLSDPPVGSAFS